MRAVPNWVDKVHDREHNEQCIYDLCFRYITIINIVVQNPLNENQVEIRWSLLLPNDL